MKRPSPKDCGRLLSLLIITLLFSASPGGLGNSPAAYAGQSQAGAYSVVVSNEYQTAVTPQDTLSLSTVAAWGNNAHGEISVPSGLTNIVALAAGGYHNLALKPDGTLVSWGYNSYGQASTPANATNIVAVAGGGSHSLALKADGTVLGWGYNSYGQATVPTGLSNVVAIAAGATHNLALKADGTVVAWGNNANWQSTVPRELVNVVAIAAGDSHSLALKADGTVVGWGANYYSQAAAPAGLSNVVAISAGSFHSLALKANGTLALWGANAYGQSFIPSGLSNVIAISAGAYHNLALKADGTAVAWGRNDYGETVIPAGLKDLVAVAAGYTHSLALVGNGAPRLSAPLLNRAVAYGMNVQFRATALGTPPFSYQWLLNGTNLPGATNAVLALNNVQPAQLGLYSVVVSNQFGSFTSSQATLSMVPLWITTSPQNQSVLLGNSATFTASAQTAIPFTYQWLFNGQPLPNATNNTLQLNNVQFSQGGLYSFNAANAYGSVTSSPALLSVPQLALWSYPANPLTNWPPDLTNAVSIAAGNRHNLALKSDGTVAAWGENDTGQTTVPAGLSNVIAIAAGYKHSVALKADGKVVAWGNNSGAPANLPPGLTNVVAISSTHDHSLALKKDGTVVAWGTNLPPGIVPLGLTNVVAIAAGGLHSLALTGDGRVVKWGYTDYYSQMNVPHDLTNVVAIAAGYWHSLALLANGTVVAWGRSDYAQTYVPWGLSNVVAIAAGDYHSLALKSDGTVVAWGANFSSQISMPAGMSNIVAISAGSEHTLVLAGSGPPFITSPLVNRTVVAGFGANFYVSATGARPLTYQWEKLIPGPGDIIQGATNPILNNAFLPGLYAVQVSNPFGTAVSPEAELNLVPLQFLEQPQSQTNWLFGRVDFNAVVESSIPVGYQWLRDGVALTDDARITGARSNRLSINDLQFSDTGNYVLVLSNAVSHVTGSLTSQVARLEVTNSLPIITCQPANQNADAGYDATFSVCVASHLPYSVQWYHNGEILPGATSNVLVLRNVWTSDAGNYWCVVSNRAGTVSSTAASLTVSLVSPTITNPPFDLEVDAGMDTCFRASVYGAPPPALQWQYNEQNIPGATNYSYCLSSVSSNKAGYYRIVASNVAGVAVSANVSLTVLYRPPVIGGPSSQDVWAGDYAYFVCDVAGGPKPSLQWYYEGQPLPGAKGSVLSFLVTSTSQEGDYWLVASNVFSAVTSSVAHLTVLVNAPTFTLQPLSRGVVAGSGVIFIADASGNPPPAFQWQRNGEDIPEATNNILSIQTATTNDSGNYVLIAFSEGGRSTSEVARLLVSPAGPLDHWQWRQPLPQGNDLVCGAYGNGMFVLMGKAGARVRSVDNGVSWQSYNGGDLYAQEVAYGNGMFVAVGGSYSSTYSWMGQIQSSQDGIHWNSYDLAGLDELVLSVAYGNGRFVAASWTYLLTSTNGLDWTLTDDAELSLYNISFGNGRFVALSSRSTTIAYSTDGVNWTTAQITAPGGFNDLAFGNGKFIISGNYFTNSSTLTYALVSTNGDSWASSIIASNYFPYLSTGSNLFLAISIWTTPMQMASSVDGIHWTLHNPVLDDSILGLMSAGPRTIAFGDKGTILSSTDLENWTMYSPGSPTNLRAIAHGNNRYVAVGNEGLVFTSTNRVNWSRHQAPTAYNLRSIAFGNDRFVAVGDIETNQAVVLTSNNGIDWWGSQNNINSGLYSVTFGKGIFVAVGWYGTVAVSQDGFVWTIQDSSTTARLNAITFNGDMFVAVGRNGAIVTSTNGLNWLSRYSGLSFFLQGVACGNGLFVAAGQSGTLATSTNGVYWNSIYGSGSPLEYNSIEDVQFANGQFIAVGDNGFLSSSADGVIWTEHKTGCQNPLRNLVYADGYVIPVGNNETILQSDFFGPPILRVRSIGPDGFEFSMDGQVGCTYRLQASEDMVNWEDVFTFSNTRVTTRFFDGEAGSYPGRFYRVVSP